MQELKNFANRRIFFFSFFKGSAEVFSTGNDIDQSGKSELCSKHRAAEVGDDLYGLYLAIYFTEMIKEAV